MASIYPRGNKLWCRLKSETGAWKSKPTPFRVGDETKAHRYAAAAQAKIDARRATGATGPLTVATYAERWLEQRTNASKRDDAGRINNHVLPVLGPLRMTDVRARHVRDLVRALKKNPDLAPRTVRNIYGVLGTMFRDAVADEIIEASPCVLRRGELPGKVDKDPEWRHLATFLEPEIRSLLTSTKVPPERRVLHAIKALAGLRHGEAAGLRWRHLIDAKPLTRLMVAHSYDGRTKTEVTRAVPVHPTLAKMLTAWRTKHWERIYGRAPTPDDYVAPTRNMTPVDPDDAGDSFKLDLAKLGLRIDAGEHRDRGGHDLRAWFITTAQECGAHRDLLRVVTHPGKGDVVSGYTRASWTALCAEVAKLRFEILDGDILRLATGFATAEANLAKRWRKVATPTGFENVSMLQRARESAPSRRNRKRWAIRTRPERAGTVARLATEESGQS
jgi:integrase